MPGLKDIVWKGILGEYELADNNPTTLASDKLNTLHFQGKHSNHILYAHSNNGLLNGEASIKDEKGNTIFILHFINNSICGQYEEFENGKKIREGSLEKSSREGKQRMYDEYGFLMYEGMYENDRCIENECVLSSGGVRYWCRYNNDRDTYDRMKLNGNEKEGLLFEVDLKNRPLRLRYMFGDGSSVLLRLYMDDYMLEYNSVGELCYEGGYSLNPFDEYCRAGVGKEYCDNDVLVSRSSRRLSAPVVRPLKVTWSNDPRSSSSLLSKSVLECEVRRKKGALILDEETSVDDLIDEEYLECVWNGTMKPITSIAEREDMKEWTDPATGMKCKASVVDGEANGDYFVFYPSGNVYFKGVIEKGVFNGPAQYYYKNRQVMKSCVFKKGVLDGVFELYDDCGNYVVISQYRNGVEWHRQEYYYGKLAFESDISESGAHTGKAVEYDSEGKIVFKGKCDDNQKFGSFFRYFKKNGAWVCEERLLSGLKNYYFSMERGTKPRSWGILEMAVRHCRVCYKQSTPRTT